MVEQGQLCSQVWWDAKHGGQGEHRDEPPSPWLVKNLQVWPGCVSGHPQSAEIRRRHRAGPLHDPEIHLAACDDPCRRLCSVAYVDLVTAVCRVTCGGLDWEPRPAAGLDSSYRRGGLWSGPFGGMSRDLGHRARDLCRGLALGRDTGAAGLHTCQNAMHWENGAQGNSRLRDCESGGDCRGEHRGGLGHGRGGRHPFAFWQCDFLQEMVSASPSAEPYCRMVGSKGCKYFLEKAGDSVSV